MGEYIGLDVSLKETAVSIRRGGKQVWRGKCLSDSQVIADLIRKHAPGVQRMDGKRWGSQKEAANDWMWAVTPEMGGAVTTMVAGPST